MTTTTQTPANVFHFRQPRTWKKSLAIWLLIALAYLLLSLYMNHGAPKPARLYVYQFLLMFVAVGVLDLLISCVGRKLITFLNKGEVIMASLAMGTGGITVTDIHGIQWKAKYDEIDSVAVKPNPGNKTDKEELYLTLKDSAIVYTPSHKCADQVIHEAAEELRRRTGK